jgi:hypothetical protein
MHTQIDEQLLGEVAQFCLRYTCEVCGNFEPTNGACALGYPNEEHRERPLLLGRKVTFCKEFDLV